MANPKTAKKHALQRLKSRQGIKSPLVAASLIEEVLEQGLRVKDLPSDHVLYKRFTSNTQRKRAYLYKDNIYIFSNDNKLITTYPFIIRREENVK